MIVLKLTAGLESYLTRQYANPHGPGGIVAGALMARQHGVETLWTLSLLDLAPTDHVLDIGCGAGQGTALLASRTPRGHVSAVDLSPTMVAAATRRNKRAVTHGFIDVRRGDVASLPYASGLFDKVVSVHSLYFWPDPVRAAAEIARVLKPGGRLALTFAPGRVDAENDPSVVTLVHGSLTHALQGAGLVDLQVEAGPSARGYRAAALVGVKPS